MHDVIILIGNATTATKEKAILCSVVLHALSVRGMLYMRFANVIGTEHLPCYLIFMGSNVHTLEDVRSTCGVIQPCDLNRLQHLLGSP